MQRKNPQFLTMSGFGKNQEKHPTNDNFGRFGQKQYFLEVFLDFFINSALLGAEVFCVAFSASKRLFCTIISCFWTIFKNVHHKGWWGGPKVTRHGKKGQKNFLKKNLNQGAKGNKKIGGRRFGHHMWCFHGHSMCTVLLYTGLHCDNLHCSAL